MSRKNRVWGVALLLGCLPILAEAAIQDRWLFDDTPGNTAVDSAGGNNTAELDNMETGDWVTGKVGTALLFDGVNEQIYTNVQYSNPQVYSLAVWFKTTSTAGNVMLEFVDTKLGGGSAYDRILYVGTDSKVRYGTSASAVIASASTYVDGQWHLAIATQNGAAGELFVDNASQGTLNTAPFNYAGYWRIAGQRLAAWPNGTDGTFAGTLDIVEIYDHVLNASERTALFAAGAPSLRRKVLSID